MRDIRSDLEERAHIVQEQVRVAYAHFERMANQGIVFGTSHLLAC